MSLIEKLKSLLGLGDSKSSRDGGRNVDVTVERESGSDGAGQPDAGTERSVKEPASDAESTGQAGDSADGGAAESTGTNGAPAAAGEADETEPGEAEDDGNEEEPRVPSEAVDVIKGIGPTYAGRLSEAGVETVDDLAEADAADLSERADVPQGRVENWIEQARARSR